MPARRKVYLAWLIWVVGGMAFGALGAATENGLWFVLLGVLFVGTAVFTMNVRCGRCRYPLLKRERTTDIGHLTVWVPVVPRHCPRCGQAA